MDTLLLTELSMGLGNNFNDRAFSEIRLIQILQEKLDKEAQLQQPM
jgi:hypothetical protein